MSNEGYLQKKKQPIVVNKTLVVPISSDKGLCGGVNSSVIRVTKEVIGQSRDKFRIFSIGDKGTNGLIRPFPDLVDHAVTELSTPMNFTLASSIAHQVDSFATDCNNIVIVYNWFKNSISNETRSLEIMSRKEFCKQFKFVTKHDMAEPEGYYT
jgi:F-type H+-transporting ATPase subunit gamma